MDKKEILKDTLGSMNQSYEELRIKLKPVFHNKTKHVNGKLLKDCFKHVADILRCHQFVWEHYYNSEFKQNTSGELE